MIFRSLAVPIGELERIALEDEAVQLTIKASLRGGMLTYSRDDGTKISYSVEGRPVMISHGRPGDSAFLGGTGSFYKVTTNQPTAEVFTMPIEDSANGVIVNTVPLWTDKGIIEAPYRIFVKEGQVYEVQAPTIESKRILRHYTGLEPYLETIKDADHAKAFACSRVIAEQARGGLNPVMKPYIEEGRLLPVTGEILLDEKVADHFAFGTNEVWHGKVPSVVGIYKVAHQDFGGSLDCKMTLSR